MKSYIGLLIVGISLVANISFADDTVVVGSNKQTGGEGQGDRQRMQEIQNQANQLKERQAAERAAREQAAREQAAREQAAREQAAREQAAREQAARKQGE